MRKTFLLFFTVLLTVLFSAQSYAQNWNEVVKIVPSDRDFFDYFGIVDIDGDYAVVGAMYSDYNGGGIRTGSAYIYIKEGNNWVQLQQIASEEGEDNAFFGQSVAINGDNIIVGALYGATDANGENPISGAGSAYIYKLEGGIWVQKQKIVAQDRETNDAFGVSVDIKGDYAIIGASSENNNGAAYVFKNEEGVWVQQQKIVAPERAIDDQFGFSVAIDNDFIIVGAYKEDEDNIEENFLQDSGSAYIFRRDGNIWLPQQKIVALDRAAQDQFGWNVAIMGDYAVIGSYQGKLDANGQNPLNGAGSAYIFKWDGINWEQQQKIVASDRASQDSFGRSVAIDGDYVVVGADQGKLDANGENPLNNAGAAYIFKRNEDNWTQQQKIVASDRGADDIFGYYVSIGSNRVIVGAVWDSEDANGENPLYSAGSAYIFELCDLSDPVTETTVNICSGENATLSVDEIEGVTAYWYDSEEATEPIFTGTEFETPVLTETTLYWVEYSETAVCFSNRVEITVQVNSIPEITVETTEFEICEGTSVILTAASDGTINWYGSEGASEPVFTGASYETPELFETTSFWVEAQSGEGCVSERIEIVINVLPLPVLQVENIEIEICSGNDAYLYAFSEGNVVFWYANEDDAEYLYHGNNFIVPGLTETTTFWVEAFNLQSGCFSDRTEVTVIVNPIPEVTAETTEFEICEGDTATLTATSNSTLNWYDNFYATEAIFTGAEFTTPALSSTTQYWVEAIGEGECTSERIEFTVIVNPTPEAPQAEPVQLYEEGMTLADFEVDYTGTITWYADEELTIVLPNTTPVVLYTIYYVTQTIGNCESEAAEVKADEFLNTGNNIKDDFAYYPNPVKDKLHFKGTEKVESVQIFDMSGRLVMNQSSKSNGIEELNLSTLPKGSYVLKVQTNKEIKTFKIIKN